jgi:hypothetical protein
MYYICVEDDKVISILNYQPNVPDTVQVCEISDYDHDLLKKGNYYFNVVDMMVEMFPQEHLDLKTIEETKNEYRSNLSKTDWQVLRHIREKALNIKTTLSEDEYIALENLRQKWVNFINK